MDCSLIRVLCVIRGLLPCRGNRWLEEALGRRLSGCHTCSTAHDHSRPISFHESAQFAFPECRSNMQEKHPPPVNSTAPPRRVPAPAAVAPSSCPCPPAPGPSSPPD